MYCRKIFLFLSVIALSLFFPGRHAYAQEGTTPPDPAALDMHILQASPDPAPFMFANSLWMPSDGKYGAGAQSYFAYKPFSIYNLDSSGNVAGERASVVGWLTMTDIMAYYGYKGDYLFAVSVPVGLVSGHTIDEFAKESGDVPVFAWGDIRMYARGRFWKAPVPVGILDVGADAYVLLPTGQFSNNYTGQTLPTIYAGGIAQYEVDRILAVANLGFIWRMGASDSEFFDGTFNQGSQMHFDAGAFYKLTDKIDVGAEFLWRTGFSTDVHDNPMEIGIGGHYYVGKGIHVRGGIHAGVVSGMGVPVVRATIGLVWYGNLKDTDHDGVPDEEDRCPVRPEDRDGFKDSDGCPDLDNDNDGISDEEDKCPNKPEDMDSFQDDDGCPDPDNDGDGIPDKQDNCPGAKGPRANKGCPANMIDSDEDGVADSDDQCPKTPGDRQRKGCPADRFDSDKDGLVDAKDKCPLKKGTEKYGGCPASMFDTDADGVPDDLDKCPNEKETINGVKDFDGCSDKGKSWYTIAEGNVAGETVPVIRFKSHIRWFTDKYGTQLSGEGKAALGQVILFTRTHPDAVKKVLILVFTDTLIDSGRAMDVTKAQAKAVKAWLKEHRMPDDKYDVQPMGGEMPIYRRGGERKQKYNRRLEFIIRM